MSFRLVRKSVDCAKFVLTSCVNRREGPVSRSARYSSVTAFNKDMEPSSTTSTTASNSALHSRNSKSTKDLVETAQNTDLLKNLEIFQWLGNKTACYPIDGSKVRVLNEPSDLYRILISKAAAAKKRVTLSSLYIGTGVLENDIIKTLENNLKSRSSASQLKIRILLDASRGSRGEKNSRTLVLPLLQSFSQQCSVHLYHTPALRGLLMKILPERWNEIIGLQHMKIYIFDDTLVISGANLSHDYFTNRQDRYIVVEDCKELVDFYDRLVETVSQFSFQLDSNNSLHMDPNFPHHPYKSSGSDFATEAKRRIEKLLDQQKKEMGAFLGFQWPNAKSTDTWIFPFIQMGQLGIYMDNVCTQKILEEIPPNAELSLATGYFNLTEEYLKSILEQSQPNVHILMAHPQANGFLGARGVAGGIPSAYTLLAKQFYQRVLHSAHDARIRLWEYRRKHWTFHAKGLWISFNGSDPRPCFTLIGSPNFGYRSVYRDLETQLAIVTINSSLRQQLHQERKDLFQLADPVSGTTFDLPERKIPLWVRFVIKVFRRFF